ncbi:response regulator [Tellurirhabdus rosea]|uniref:response regulator n=1 Tax=Tellurirhabdus rosea TaxID=2674997 RepID=UPI0022558C38|nr:response regulator transcription factor [Tellurirhabdus rosea]
MPLRLLLADDHQLFADGLRSLLESEHPVVGWVRNGREVVRALEEQPVDVVLMDIEMPVMDGLEAARQVKKRWPQVKVLAVSMRGDYDSVRKMLLAGADGYLLKSVGKSELMKALEVVQQGQIYVCPELAPVLFHGVARRPMPANLPGESLTRREKEITALIVDGFKDREIADKLNLAPDTIKTHRRNILAKLGCRNTASLVKYVLETRLLEKE